MRALRVVPGKVKLRIAGALCGAALCIGSLLWALQGWWFLQTGLAAVLLSVGGYVGWCRWPRWRWGITAANLGDLQQPAQQRLRLTFDDGPTPGVTNVVLDRLQQHGIAASFFVLVSKARRHPDLVRRIVAEGHTLGLHGEDHRLPFGYGTAELQGSLERARTELAQLAGRPIELYRPSHGFKNIALLRAVRRLGLRFCFWDYGVWDTDAPPADVLVQRMRAVVPGPDEVPGPVLLLHDGLGDLPEIPPHAASMTAALSSFLPLIRTAATK